VRHFTSMLTVLLLLTQGAQAETIEGLISAGQLEVHAALETPAPHFQKAPIVIAVEVGTPALFKRGTRVRSFSVAGAVVRPVSKFALNESRRRDGETWAFQTLRFQIYAERTGVLNIPALMTSIAVKHETHGVVEGEVSLEVSPIEVEVPPGTEALTDWVATTGFEVKDSWEGVLEEYQVGDAVTRVRRFTISGAPAMVIPASPQAELEGVQVYRAPPMVDDRAVGGSFQGVREERVVYTFKAGGAFTIPNYRIHWFNLDTGSVEQIDLPGRTLSVAGDPLPTESVTPEAPGVTGRFLNLGLVLLGIVAVIVLLRWMLRTTLYASVRAHLQAWRTNRLAKKSFMQAAAQQDSHRCLALLYEQLSARAQWQLSAACAGEQKLSVVSAALMAHAYGDGQAPEVSELRRLWEACSVQKTNRTNSLGQLRLNPAASL
jgi:hypothetical protein